MPLPPRVFVDPYGNAALQRPIVGEPYDRKVVVVPRFEVPHTDLPPAHFCEYGFVIEWNRKFYLGLAFTKKEKKYWYPREEYESISEVIRSMEVYVSASWATSPNGPEYDPKRFGPGTYEPFSG
jgi:hypothetical protein